MSAPTKRIPSESTALFVYDFPHKKSVDFIIRMVLAGYHPLVIAAPRKKLGAKASVVRHHEFADALYPRDIAALLGLEYHVLPHESNETVALIQDRQIELGVIGAARILPKKVIDAFRVGVLNFHNGLLPYNPGLGALKRAWDLDIPQGVTAHLIDERVDAGTIVGRWLVRLRPDDTPLDVDLRIYETINLVLPEAIKRTFRQEFSVEIEPRETRKNGWFSWNVYLQRWVNVVSWNGIDAL